MNRALQILITGMGVALLLFTTSCKKDPCEDNPCLNGGICVKVSDDDYRCDCPTGLTGTNCESNPLDTVTYNPQPFEYNFPAFPIYGPPINPPDNQITEEGVQLGRMLFYDPILSGDSTLSCAGCHFQEFAFTDRERAVSVGIDGIAGNRNSMPIQNLAFFNQFFWDARAATLEEQALFPVPDPIEMHLEWPEGELRLRNHPDYPRLFKKAFNISTVDDIDRVLVTKAIAQFERSIITVDSKFDRVLRGEDDFTELEGDGQLLFNTESGTNTDVECFHCHGGNLFTDNQFRNNGLTEAATPNDFPDLGLGGITGRDIDKGKFKTPTLRNIEKTAPYMHDGRFATLEEVIDHYESGGHPSPNVDVLVSDGIDAFTEYEKQALIAFLKTLTDEVYLNNPDYSNPFN